MNLWQTSFGHKLVCTEKNNRPTIYSLCNITCLQQQQHRRRHVCILPASRRRRPLRTVRVPGDSGDIAQIFNDDFVRQNSYLGDEDDFVQALSQRAKINL